MLDFTKVGAISAAIGIATGAFGAHALKSSLPDPSLLKTWETAVLYHLIHSLGLILVGMNGVRAETAGYLMLFGILLFSGSLYTLVLTRIKILGAITPIGGVLLIVSWLFFAFR